MALHQNTGDDSSAEESCPTWWRALPVLTGPSLTLRELRAKDAPGLLPQLQSPNLCRYIASPPSTLANLRTFIRWTHRARRQRRHLAFGVFPAGGADAIGLMQLWKIESDFSVAECGFVLGEDHWGSGAFTGGARLMLEFAFNTLGVHRLEARAASGNARGNAALRKIGALREGLLRDGFKNNRGYDGGYDDHVMWSILAPEWRDRSRSSRRVG
jgi:RimJ/RimL family protein N-acetyltransferase